MNYKISANYFWAIANELPGIDFKTTKKNVLGYLNKISGFNRQITSLSIE